MARRRVQLTTLGKQFGKWDLDRIGYFQDENPAPFGEYTGKPVLFREGINEGRQMFPGPRTDLFEEKFVRIFHGEALNEPWRIEAQERLQRDKDKIGGHLLPPAPAKKHSTPGDWHGCFEKVTYFSPAVKKRVKGVPELPNVRIKPNPRGGPGYPDICLNPFPSYSHEPYDIPRKRGKPIGRFLYASAAQDYFPPNPYLALDTGPTYVRPKYIPPKMIGPGHIYVQFPKKPGGNHSGCFNKFPEYPTASYYKEIEREKKEVAVFVAGGPPRRSKYTNSIVDQVTGISCNSTNYATYREQVYPLDK